MLEKQERRQIKNRHTTKTKHNPEKSNNTKYSKTKLAWFSCLNSPRAHTRLVFYRLKLSDLRHKHMQYKTEYKNQSGKWNRKHKNPAAGSKTSQHKKHDNHFVEGRKGCG